MLKKLLITICLLVMVGGCANEFIRITPVFKNQKAPHSGYNGKFLQTGELVGYDGLLIQLPLLELPADGKTKTYKIMR